MLPDAAILPPAFHFTLEPCWSWGELPTCRLGCFWYRLESCKGSLRRDLVKFRLPAARILTLSILTGEALWRFVLQSTVLVVSGV
jgi:hypothetical protein